MQTYQSLVAAAVKAAPPGHGPEQVQIQIGSATCEDAAGAPQVARTFGTLIAGSGRSDIVLTSRGCTGRCSEEPIVTVRRPGELPVNYCRVNEGMVAEIFVSHVLNGKPLASALLGGAAEVAPRYQFVFCGSEQCGTKSASALKEQFEARLKEEGIGPEQATVLGANCFGICSSEELGQVTHALVRPTNVVYRIQSAEDMDAIIRQHIREGHIVQRLISTKKPISQKFFELYADVAFFQKQSRVVLRNCGVSDPESLDDYLRHNGFHALATVLERNDPAWVIEQITNSKLRGRGGAGYPTGRKWRDVGGRTEEVKYIVCNADEGDPGAFMDRDMLESDPFSVLEGMLIAAFAIGARNGFLYIRSEYPLAVKRIEKAITLCHKAGLVGKDIMGAKFEFDLEVRLGAGAFVCGEETALLASIEGARGWPRIRPPYPTHKGLWGKPTVINNVETFANVSAIIDYGAKWFAQIGTAKSGGTKVFALTGKVTHTGLVEVPMGTSLREIIYDIGGGIPGGKALKAVQTGGPAGGCIPARNIDTLVDYDTLTQAGSIMGSGGMIVMDETACMVDIARFYMTFSQDESCGECTPCREGCMRMLEILERIATGAGEMEDLTKLERLGNCCRRRPCAGSDARRPIRC